MAAVHVGHADDVSVGVDGDVAPEEFAVRRIDGQRLHLAQAVADDAAARVFFTQKQSKSKSILVSFGNLVFTIGKSHDRNRDP